VLYAVGASPGERGEGFHLSGSLAAVLSAVGASPGERVKGFQRAGSTAEAVSAVAVSAVAVSAVAVSAGPVSAVEKTRSERPGSDDSDLAPVEALVALVLALGEVLADHAAPPLAVARRCRTGHVRIVCRLRNHTRPYDPTPQKSQ